MSDSDIELARRAIALLDLTDLTDDASVDGIDRLCERAALHGTAAVCVWPDFVRQSVEALRGTSVLVATVVNFPSGDDRPHAVRVLTEHALDDGADEIDVVLPYRAWLAGDEQRAADVIDGVRAAAVGRRLKVILETGALPDDAAIERAARFAIEHGADFIKTSTGKIEISATPEAAKTMLRVIAETDRPIGIKPSGGIRTIADAALYLALADDIMGPSWASPATFRFGASGVLDALVAALEGRVLEPSESSSY
ncbi:MAG TPA: deoxyribose-phosphate aldolase [Ilumatobacteraceae bacterium]|nr:deoxyribose-phosphate aldolase [Ilumatobacteraceae bacterium]